MIKPRANTKRDVCFSHAIYIDTCNRITSPTIPDKKVLQKIQKKNSQNLEMATINLASEFLSEFGTSEVRLHRRHSGRFTTLAEKTVSWYVSLTRTLLFIVM